MFGRQNKQAAAQYRDAAHAQVLVVSADQQALSAIERRDLVAEVGSDFSYEYQPLNKFKAKRLSADFLLSLFVDPEQLDTLADAVIDARQKGSQTTLIVAIQGAQLLALGRWLKQRAQAGRLEGLRLMLEHDLDAVIAKLPQRLQPVVEDNVIRMPLSTEVENSGSKDFYVFSPELHALVAQVRGYAENGVTRAYLLGGPGSGKTTLAYYYYLVRQSGRFISVNLAAENTGDKSAVKSLLCGHVTGAFPGAGSRSGAFLLADDGLCFIDESHGVMGPVMEVLMEALDNNQYLPLGAAAKQPLRCAILFATNRSWEHLQESVNLDEFTRIGAATLEVPELHKREEDMIAVIAATLAKLAAPCTTWTAPVGLAPEAVDMIKACRWHGNVRAVIRVMESAFVETAPHNQDAQGLIPQDAIQRGLGLWEPEDHHSHEIYATL